MSVMLDFINEICTSCNSCTFVSIDSWDESAHPKECNTMYYMSDGSGFYVWNGQKWVFNALGGSSGNFVTEQEFNDYKTQQDTVDTEQDSRLDYLDNETLILNTEFQGLAGDVTDINLRINDLENELKPIYDNFTDVWNNPLGTELEVIGTKLSFVFIRQSNGTYLPYVKNLGSVDINIWFRTVQEYDGGSSTIYSQSSSLLVPVGGMSDKLDNDSYGLGYGNYPNFTKISITIDGSAEFYIWEAQSNSRTNAANTGTISSVIRRYF